MHDIGNGAGAGLISVVWPGKGTLIAYNAADLAISIFFIGPLADRYISMDPPPAAMDGGVLEGDPPIADHTYYGDPALRGAISDLGICSDIAFQTGWAVPYRVGAVMFMGFCRAA